MDRPENRIILTTLANESRAKVRLISPSTKYLSSDLVFPKDHE